MPRDPVVLAHELLGRGAGEIEPLVVFSDRAHDRLRRAIAWRPQVKPARPT